MKNRVGRPNGSIKNHNKFVEEVIALTGDEYTVLDTYIGANIKINFRHNLCGKIFKLRPSAFLYGSRCPRCEKREYKRSSISIQEKTDLFKQRVFNLVGDEYTVLGEYTKAMNKILMRHNICDYEYYVTPNEFLKGTRCPYCYISKGEDKIRQFLIHNNIIFETQYRIKECRNKLPLPFDFAIFEDKDKTKLSMLIEYDGIQHFNIDGWNNCKEKYEQTKHNDFIKNEYCKNHNIQLLRIPYWDFLNIDEILTNYLLDRN